jgi:hypothetical protein
MSDFGDAEPEDSYDVAPPDPEQVALRLHELREAHGLEVRRWEELTLGQQRALIAVVAMLLDWLRREGSLR